MNQLNIAQQLDNQQHANVETFPVENKLVKHSVNVHKFGGSSLANAQCIERVIDIIRQNCQLNDIIVVSANGVTTDKLFSIYELAKDEESQFTIALDELTELQQSLIKLSLNEGNASRLSQLLIQDVQQLNILLSNNASAHQSDILAFGEVWSARLLSAILNERVCPSYMLDARDFLVVNNSHDCQVDKALSAAQFRQNQQQSKLAVVTGYITKDSHGQTCTLGRNGSDYSATIMGALTQALNVTLWTDVDGIYSADPRIVPNARKLHRLPNGVAKELGRLGNPVLHAKTLQPLMDELSDHTINLHVASSFDAQISGTEIGRFGQIAKQELSVTLLNELLLAQSDSFRGQSGIRASKEFSVICNDSKKGFVVITLEQQKALSQWLASHDTEVTFKPVSILAVVGHKVAKQGDIRARFTRSLKSAQPLELVNSASGHSIIAVLSQVCTGELLNNIHHDMTKYARNIGLVVAGLGNIGQRFIEMLPTQLSRVPALENLHLVGLLSSKKALINTDGIDVTDAENLFNQHAKTYDHQLLMSWLSNHPYDELIVVDVTPSEQFSQLYGEFFKQGIHVIGANKWAASSSTDQYQYLLKTARENHSLWLGNTTVGAGLPINYAIDDLKNSGDEILEISGVFSGTLSWLFETYDGNNEFSVLLREALAEGITEPDPRDDLSGRDVQRKLLILARAAGFTLSLADIECQNLVPETLQELTTEDFLSRADELDQYFYQKLTEAKNNNASIRYVARFKIDNQKIIAKVSLEQLPDNDAFAGLTPGDNIFKINSNWYKSNPLIIRGPGAGRDVTSGGIHSDLVNICQQLAHKQNQVKIKGIN
ncbi:MAG: bifunctional aspartate kinase/homoserine dehydrogenase II [Alteromonadaceae bacterium]|nr:bifunctional aspartate kinase/homoserine dehydrogenase II [Alteromonadaceae bacterium]